jgi:K+-transporting ATPase KdpF subunit
MNNHGRSLDDLGSDVCRGVWGDMVPLPQYERRGHILVWIYYISFSFCCSSESRRRTLASAKNYEVKPVEYIVNGGIAALLLVYLLYALLKPERF